MNLYRSEDIDAITNELDNIIEASNDRKASILEPTRDECYAVRDEIRRFVKSKKRIIYGGTAYDDMIKAKDPNDGVYSKKECKDVEFYSPKPIEDMIDLCKILNLKFKYVTAREANHEETYTIFVNFAAMCDITYMPGPIFYNVKTLSVNNIQYSHPSFILIDILRQYNDPLNSYWRLKEKTYFRANKLLKHYPLELDQGKYTPSKIEENKLNLMKFLFDEIKHIDSLIHLGAVANNYYLHPNKSNIIIDQPLVVITDKLYENANSIYMLCLKYLSIQDNLEKADDLISLEQYHPFFQFWDKRVIIKYMNCPIITILGHNKICLPYHKVEINNNSIEKIKYGGHRLKLKGGSDKLIHNNIKLGTFMLLFNYHLIDMHYLQIYKYDKLYKEKQRLMSALLKARDNFLKDRKLTVIDKSPYQEFIIDCYGKTIDPLYETGLRMSRRKAKGMRIKLYYDPNQETEFPVITFKNTSGNIINNPKGWIIKESETEVEIIENGNSTESI